MRSEDISELRGRPKREVGKLRAEEHRPMPPEGHCDRGS